MRRDAGNRDPFRPSDCHVARIRWISYRKCSTVLTDKIDLIPQWIFPDRLLRHPTFYKEWLGTEGKVVLLTFGLLSPNKGIENVIQALPEILSHHTNVVYMVSGVTHPHLLRREGEKYRVSLQNRAKDLGVEANVIFRNRFVSPQERRS